MPRILDLYMYFYIPILGLFLYYIIIKTKEALFGPLSDIPGPTLAKWTHLRLKVAVLGGKRMHYIHALHERYGGIVRISPWELSISDPLAVKEIHKIQSGYRKSDWYPKLTNELSNPGLFAMTDTKDHAERRKLLAQPLSSSSLKKVHGSVRVMAQVAVNKIKGDIHLKGTADIFKWWIFFATDMIGELSFGDSFRMLEQGKKDIYINDLESTQVMSGLFVEFPLLRPLFNNLPIPAIKHLSLTQDRLSQYGKTSIARYKRSLAIDPSQSVPTLFTKILQSKTVEDSLVEGEAKSYIVAGSDTTAITLTYLIWAVLSHPEIHRKALAEAQALPEDFTSDDFVNKIPYVNNVIEETLRLYGAAPGSLPRVVPSGGRELAGYFVPEGTTVCTQSYTGHRDGNVFQDPTRFMPERWENPTKAMKDSFQPFGAGSRTCIGIHLAYLELRTAFLLFLRDLPTASIAPQTTAEDMEMENYFLIKPRAHSCFIQDTGREENNEKGEKGMML